MGYYHIKNINLDKENNKITAEFADNNISPLTYYKSEIKGKDFHEKYSNLIYDIILGNYHPSGNSKYYSLCNAWSKSALENFSGDCKILGVERAFEKYKKVIKAIIENKKPEIIKSEIELHYNLDYGENKNYENLSRKVNLISASMQELSDKKLSFLNKLSFFKKLKESEGLTSPLVTLKGIENSTKLYLNFYITETGYPSFRVTVESMESGRLKTFENKYMNITWITSYSENEMAYRLQNYEKKFLLYQKCRNFLEENVFKNSSKESILQVDSLNIKSEDIRTLLDVFREDEKTKNYKYNKETNEIIFNPIIEKEVNNIDNEMEKCV